MVERKLYKTKLCVLFQKGRCTRDSCSFAHGDAELRRFSGSFHGKRGFGNGDLRDKLDRKHSSPRRVHSPVRDSRGRNTVHAMERGQSRSPGQESDRRHRKKRRLDGHSEVSGSLRISDGVEQETRERKILTHSRLEQLKQVQLDFNRLDKQKSELLVKMEERVQEVESLTSKIQELEVLLLGEDEENQRIVSKINKFVEAYNRRSRIQDQLKKSEVWLHKLGDDLGLHINKFSANEEDLSVNMVSDDEANNEKQNDGLQSNEKQEGGRFVQESKQNDVDLAKVHVKVPATSKKVSRWNIPAWQSYDKEIEAVASRNGQQSQLANANKSERTKIASILSEDKPKSLVSKPMLPVLPPTSMAAHAVDEEIEIEKDEILGPCGRLDNGDTLYEIKHLPFILPPLPPILKTNYALYEGDDEDIDVDGVDEDAV